MCLLGVFDHSSKFKGMSLNDQVLKEPDLMNNPVGVSLGFREKPVTRLSEARHVVKYIGKYLNTNTNTFHKIKYKYKYKYSKMQMYLNTNTNTFKSISNTNTNTFMFLYHFSDDLLFNLTYKYLLTHINHHMTSYLSQT